MSAIKDAMNHLPAADQIELRLSKSIHGSGNIAVWIRSERRDGMTQETLATVDRDELLSAVADVASVAAIDARLLPKPGEEGWAWNCRSEEYIASLPAPVQGCARSAGIALASYRVACDIEAEREAEREARRSRWRTLLKGAGVPDGPTLDRAIEILADDSIEVPK